MSSPLRQEEVEEILSHIQNVLNEVIQAIMAGVVSDEDDINPYIVGKLDSISGKVIIIQGRVFRHRRGVANEEGTYGADILLVVNISIRGRSVKKGILIQAKMPKSDQGLRGQCEKMTRITQDSFVLIYNLDGFVFERAHIYTNGNPDLKDTYDDQDFFRHVLRCFIGDKQLDSLNPNVLDRIRPNATMSLYVGSNS